MSIYTKDSSSIHSCYQLPNSGAGLERHTLFFKLKTTLQFYVTGPYTKFGTVSFCCNHDVGGGAKSVHDLFSITRFAWCNWREKPVNWTYAILFSSVRFVTGDSVYFLCCL